jgi:hypothetical protein
MSEVLFRTSLYGRFGHLVMATLGLVVGLLFALPLLLAGSKGDVLMLVVCGGLSGGAAAVGLYSSWFAVAPGVRIRLTNDALHYRGLLGSLHLPWGEVESARINYGGRSPFVFLLLRRRGSRSVQKANVSGLTPSYEVLFEHVRQRAPHAVRSANGQGLAEALTNEAADEL